MRVPPSTRANDIEAPYILDSVSLSHKMGRLVLTSQDGWEDEGVHERVIEQNVPRGKCSYKGPIDGLKG